MELFLDDHTKKAIELIRSLGKEYLRPLGIEADTLARAIPPDHPFFQLIASSGYMSRGLGSALGTATKSKSGDTKNSRPGTWVRNVLIAEEGSYWDRGALVSLPGPGLGGPPVLQMGTLEQQSRFLSVFRQRERPVWAAFAMTEPEAGSDVARIRTNARRDGDEWILNGQKMYSSNSPRAEWVVVFATIDIELGRAGHRAFVVERGTKGFEILRIEHKMGIRAYETASFALDNCRIPYENLLGGENYYSEKGKKGFEGAMSTFNATRPIVAAMGIGIARAAYDIALKFVEEDYPKHAAGRLRKALEQLAAMQRKIMLSRLLCLKAASLLDQGKPNALAASSAKQYAPPMCLEVVEHATDILGEAGIAKDGLLEKLARDVKAIDIVEGTQQIQRRVISKNIISR